MIWSLSFIVFCGALLTALSMPYRVPLQGASGGKKTLVILGEMGTVQTHSLFFQDLMQRGHQLTYVQAESPDLIISKYGEFLFDNIIMFCPEVKDFNTIKFEDISEFVENGGNVLFGANELISDSMRLFASSNGIDFSKHSTEVLDYFESSKEFEKAIVVHGLAGAPILDSFGKEGVLFKGISHSVDKSNVLAVNIMWGNPTTFSSDPTSSVKASDIFGENTLLVSAIQARNNARLVFAGSLDMFSNKYLSAQEGANEKFLESVSKWNFGESGVLRFRDIMHHKKDGTPPDVILHEKKRPDLPETLYPDPEITRNSLVYRIKDEIVYSMVVEQFNGNEWVPFCASDMQMEFVMLDPYVRKTMTCNPSTGRHEADFISPDKYGVFKFRVFYRRPGYSALHAETQVSLRPFKHNEYERFIASAYPYYTSAFSAMFAFFVFSLAFLFAKK